MTAFSEFDRRAMSRALELAERGAETTHPNPRVGCVIARGTQIIAEGWHERAGGPHAEVVALQKLSPGGVSAAEGCTAYVTLEPCSHHGKTPPCVNALIAARLGRVVYAIDDPNPEVSGRGAASLRAAGIEVISGLMAGEAEAVNEGFLMRMRAGRPFVRVKLGASIDGRIALANGKSQWITGESARDDVQRWRARSSAVLTGIGTVLADDPQLNVRSSGAQRQPLRVVLDSESRTPASARIRDASAPTLILTRSDIGGDEQGRQSLQGVQGLDLKAVLAKLGSLEMNEVLVEAGPRLSGAFVRQGLADELLIYMAPKLLGPQARPLFDLPLLEDLQQAPRFRIIEQRLIGEDLRVRLRAR